MQDALFLIWTICLEAWLTQCVALVQHFSSCFTEIFRENHWIVLRNIFEGIFLLFLLWFGWQFWNYWVFKSYLKLNNFTWIRQFFFRSIFFVLRALIQFICYLLKFPVSLPVDCQLDILADVLYELVVHIQIVFLDPFQKHRVCTLIVCFFMVVGHDRFCISNVWLVQMSHCFNFKKESLLTVLFRWLE